MQKPCWRVAPAPREFVEEDGKKSFGSAKKFERYLRGIQSVSVWGRKKCKKSCIFLYILFGDMIFCTTFATQNQGGYAVLKNFGSLAQLV